MKRLEHIIHRLIFGIVFLLSFILLNTSAWISDFDSDELSAIIRATKSFHFAEHLQIGILPDGHPAGIQTVIWLGTHFGGWNPAIFRLIWIALTLIGNVYFKKWMYQLALKNGESKLSAVWISLLGYAFISLMWWPLSLGTWLRPYAPGFSILMLFFYHFERLQLNHRNWIWSAVFLGLLGYIHYFALLTGLVFFVFSWGWDYRFNSSKLFFKIGLVALIINLPQISVIFNQFQLAGLNWLGPPTPHFLIHHFKYICGNNNWILWIFIASILVNIFFQNRNWKNGFNRNGLIWVLVLIILYSYSVFRKPVLQHNALYFAFPLFISKAVESIFSIFNWIGAYLTFNQSNNKAIPSHSAINIFNKLPKESYLKSVFAMCFILLSLNNTLFEKRHFSEIRLHDRYAEPFRVYKNEQLNLSKNSMLLIDGPVDLLEYHKQDFLGTSIKTDNLLFIQKLNTVPQKKSNQLWLDWSNGVWGKDTLVLALNSGSDVNILNILNHCSKRISLTWNHKKWVHRTVGGEIQCFVRKKANGENSNSILGNKKMAQYRVLSLDSTASVFVNLNTFKINSYDLIGIRFISNELKLDSIKLVSALFKEGFNKARIQYDYRWEQGSTDSCIYLTLKLIDIPDWDHQSILRLNLESANPQLKEFTDSRIEIEIIPGNPFAYGI